MATTLKTLSEKTGVSKSVISMYLNKDPRVRLGDAKKRLIDQAVKELNYRPSRTACSLRKGHSNLLGLVVGGILDPFFARMTEALLKYAEDRGYQLLISLTSWNVEKEKKCLEMLLDREVDGVIYAPRFPDEELFRRKIVESNIPVLLTNREIPGLPSVCQNMTLALDDMVKMFAALGCRELAVPTYPDDMMIRRLELAGAHYGVRIRLMPFYDDDEIVRRLIQEQPEFLYIPSCWIAKDMLALRSLLALDYNPEFVTGYCFPIDFLDYDGLRGVVFGNVYEYLSQVMDCLIACVENKELRKTGVLRETEMRFLPRDEFLRQRELLTDTLDKYRRQMVSCCPDGVPGKDGCRNISKKMKF